VIAAGTWYDRSSQVSIARSRNVTKAVMGGTIASMMRAGFGRIVLVVDTHDDVMAAQETIAMLRHQFKQQAFAAASKNGNNSDDTDNDDEEGTNIVVDTTNIELTYVVATEDLYQSEIVTVNRPKAAIYGIQQALLGKFNASYSDQWLGIRHPPEYWKYVYFTENDLVLQTRPSALSSIQQALEEGYVLFPARLLKLPHALDVTNDKGEVYNGTNMLFPAKYNHILDLNSDEDLCCDGGIDRPEWNITKVPGDSRCSPQLWWLCGFPERRNRQKQQNQNATTTTHDDGNNDNNDDDNGDDDLRHRRVLKHTPFYRLNQGIVTLPAMNRRQCSPRKRQSPDDFCDIPPEFDTISGPPIRPDHNNKQLTRRQRRNQERQRNQGV